MPMAQANVSQAEITLFIFGWIAMSNFVKNCAGTGTFVVGPLLFALKLVGGKWFCSKPLDRDDWCGE